MAQRHPAGSDNIDLYDLSADAGPPSWLRTEQINNMLQLGCIARAWL